MVLSGVGSASVDLSSDIIPGIAETSTTGFSAPTYAVAQTLFNNSYSNENTYPFPSSGSFLACNGRTDGACNSINILKIYNTYITSYGIGGNPYTLSPEPTTLSYYAAGICSATISGYSDWYLPAICEMGPDSNGSGCNNAQNIVNQLSNLIGDPNVDTPSTSCIYGANCLAGYYWSSTESSGSPQLIAWSEHFASSGGSFQGGSSKGLTYGVRCSRALTL